jgi:YebC/PmpR family DNA-binding regulatory protein
MSGHSKWNSIKHQKAAADAKKGAVFTRTSRNITMAAKDGGGDIETNFKLKVAVEQAKAVNMPKDNIERAIKKGTGEGAENQLQESMFEGYGPEGVAIIIKTVTDNNNRTVSDVRHTLTKFGGSLGESGSVLWNFEQKGVIRLDIKDLDRDSVELIAIDADADDIQDDEDGLMITTNPKNLQNLKQELEKNNITTEYCDIEYIAKNTVDLDESAKNRLNKLTDALDELEDVNDFYTNDS